MYLTNLPVSTAKLGEKYDFSLILK